MPWIGPASKSCRDGLLAPLIPFTGLLLTGLLLVAGAVLPGRDVCGAAFFGLAAFFTGFLVDFFLLPTPFFADGLAAAFREAAFADFAADFLLTLPADFFRPAFFTVDFLFAAGFFGAAAFFVRAFFGEDFFVLNLRLFLEVFLPAAGLRDAAFFLPVPACFCFLLAAFFAGMFHSCRSEKNAELYIACPNMEPHFSGVFRPPAALFPVRGKHRMFTLPGCDAPRFFLSPGTAEAARKFADDHSLAPFFRVHASASNPPSSMPPGTLVCMPRQSFYPAGQFHYTTRLSLAPGKDPLMRLSKIKLAGFKSFVDPTTIPFPSNLVGVVGPNGCGKSNVIDAVRWVMGESSASRLRGDSITDVIFNGSSVRKPVGAASVELLFDNYRNDVGGPVCEVRRNFHTP